MSVIITAHDSRRLPLLKEALRSVASQTYADWELIVVNGDSETPLSGLLGEDLRGARARIIRSRSPLGLSEARNVGIRSARGALVATLDDDDLWLPEYLKRNVAVFDSEPELGMACSRIIEHDLRTGIIQKRMYRLSASGRMAFAQIVENECAPLSGLVFRRACWELVGGFDTSTDGVEDLDFCMRISEKFPCYFINEELVVRRFHAFNVTNDHVKIIKLGIHFWERALARSPRPASVHFIRLQLAKSHYMAGLGDAMRSRWGPGYAHLKHALWNCPWVGRARSSGAPAGWRKLALLAHPWFMALILALADRHFEAPARIWLRRQRKTSLLAKNARKG